MCGVGGGGAAGGLKFQLLVPMWEIAGCDAFSVSQRKGFRDFKKLKNLT